MKKTVRKTSKKAVRKPSLRKVQRGLSKVVLLSIIGGVLVVGGGAFFFLNNGGGSSPLAGVVKAPLNPNCEYNDPELCKFINNWQAQSDYTVTSMSKAEGETVESIFELAGQDKSRMVSKQNGKETYHVVSIGDTTYTLDYTDNKWWKYTYKPEEGKTSPEQEIKDELAIDFDESKNTTTYKFIAKEACGELTCFKYEVINQSETQDGESLTSANKEYMYFDDKEYKMRKTRTEGVNGDVHESIYSYDKVSISEPSPVKEGSPESMYGAPEMSAEEKAQYDKIMQEYGGQSESEQPVTDTSVEY